jgi:histidinol-phosphate aminotransferase
MHSMSVAIGQSRRIRLDLLQNPFGPTERVLDAIAADDPHAQSVSDLEERLRTRLGALAGVPASWIVLANGIDELQAMIARWRTDHGPLLVFPPTDPAQEAWIGQYGAQVERIPRRRGFAMPVDAVASGLPRGATAMVMSPNDPSGTVITVQETVRLTRQCTVVVIDERHAAYSPRTILPLVREFENLIVVQTLETWAGLASLPLAWAVAPPAMAREIARRSRPSGVARLSLVAALATLDDLDAVRASVCRVMLEKGRLFRQIRKLNMISPPYPSWGNFLLCRFERGSSDFFVPRLAERGVNVYRPPHPELRNHVRISAVSADWTNALKQALIEIALEM